MAEVQPWTDYIIDRTRSILEPFAQVTPAIHGILDAPWWVHLLAVSVIVVPTTWVTLRLLRRIRREAPSQVRAVKEFVLPSEGPRFRKRDKIAFMGRRVYRNAKAVGSLIRGGQGRKRKAMEKLVKKVFLRGSPDLQSQTALPGLPDEFLEEEVESVKDEDSIPLPKTLLLVLKNLRVFGHFHGKIFEKLVGKIEHIKLRAHDSLFKVGEADENMYIVESGCINVFSTTKDPRTFETQTYTLKRVRQGEAIFSLLSFIEYLGGRVKTYKTVSAKATEECKVIKVSFRSFKDSFDQFPEDLAKVVQVIMVRLQRVTLLALHQYLGLGAELLTPTSRGGSGQSHTQFAGVKRQSSLQQHQMDLPSLHQLEATSPTIAELTHGKDEHQTLLVSPTVIRAKDEIEDMNPDHLKRLAAEAYQEVLNLSDDQLDELNSTITENISITEPEEGAVLVQEDSNDSPALMLVLHGSVELSQKSTDDINTATKIHKAHVGGILCQLQTLTNEPSFFTVKAMNKGTKVARLDARYIRDAMSLYPHVSLRLAMSVIDNLSPYVRSIDFALEWLQVESGKALYKQNEEADCTYVVLSGRLRSVIRLENNKRSLVAEYGRGELTGIVETLLKTARKTTVMAVRDTEVAKIPAGLIDAIKTRYPVVMLRLLNLLGEKLHQSWSEESKELPNSQQSSVKANISTVAIISISPNIPTTAFCMELLHPLIRLDPTIRITKDYVRDELGDAAFDRSSDFRLSEWMARQEDDHRIVMYQCDTELTAWTKLCVRHADVIFLLADMKDSPAIKPIESDLEKISRRTRKEMVFLHSEDTKYPEGTAAWLKSRAWINAHYHIKCPRRMSSRKTKYTNILNGPPPDVHSDFSRLARYVMGESVGLVLGGGGARGCSHVGMIRATMEAGIPIDHVAGVSIGAFVGGLYALERDLAPVTQMSRKFSSNMVQYWRQIFDLTCPIVSYFTGYNFNGSLQDLFKERDILDCWLPYFTVTTDITCSAMRIHDYGSMWRYVRASMSLAGYLPPLCDPIDGHLLLDGGYTNNLPADIMRSRGAKHILAVDVGAEDSMDFDDYGDSLSGWKVVWSKYNPFCQPMKVPSQNDIQARLAYVSCVGKLEGVKNAGYCEYIRPPIDKYGTMQFGLFDEIKDVGYRHGETYYKGLKKAGLMRLFNFWNASKAGGGHLPGMIRRGSLSDSHNNLLASSYESDGGSPTGLPTHLPLDRGYQSSQLSELAKMVSAVQSPLGNTSHRDSWALEDEDEEDDDDVPLTDADSENLITDEEDDNESGFLSQI